MWMGGLGHWCSQSCDPKIFLIFCAFSSGLGSPVHFSEMFHCRLCWHWACSLWQMRFSSWEGANWAFVSSLDRERSRVWVNALGMRQENQRIQTHYLVIILCHLERWIAWMRRSRSKLSVQCLKWKELCPTSSWGNIKCSHTCLALAVANYGALFTCFIKLSSSACSSLLEMGSALC